MKLTGTSYTLTEQHIAIIKAVAKDHGDGSASAALRYIIDWYAQHHTPARAEAQGRERGEEEG